MFCVFFLALRSNCDSGRRQFTIPLKTAAAKTTCRAALSLLFFKLNVCVVYWLPYLEAVVFGFNNVTDQRRMKRTMRLGGHVSQPFISVSFVLLCSSLLHPILKLMQHGGSKRRRRRRRKLWCDFLPSRGWFRSWDYVESWRNKKQQQQSLVEENSKRMSLSGRRWNNIHK